MPVRRVAGTRRHKVALQSVSQQATSTGFAETWTTYASVWASVQPASAGPSERPMAQTTQAPITHLVEIDYRDDLTQSDRVLFGGTRPLYIVGQQNIDERNITLRLSCEERAA